MRILLTGGAGDLGSYVSRSLVGMGHTPVVFDIVDTTLREKNCKTSIDSKKETISRIEHIQGSVMDREKLLEVVQGIDAVVHIAAWHGIHEYKNEKSVWQFWDLNVGGTFNVFQTACQAGVRNVIFISSTSVDERYGIYGHTKVLGEEIATTYAKRHGMRVITLRPRAFIPPYNTSVYERFIDWAKWFCKGAVHISDVSQAVIKSLEVLWDESSELETNPLVLTVDGAYQYTDEDLDNWDADGPGTTFLKYYKPFYNLAIESGLDPTLKPRKLDISETKRILNYRPLYSMKTLLLELKMYGPSGPYANSESS